MNSNKNTGRIVGVLLLFVFISGITIFQYLQGTSLFIEDYITSTLANSNKIIISVLLGVFSGIVSIIIATILLPIFKKHSYTLAYLYFAFCILNFISIMIDNYNVLSMLEFSKEYVKTGNENSSSLELIKTLISQKHWWSHFNYLLISCFPVFVLYFTLFKSKLVPRIISIFGIFAVSLMFIEEVITFFGHSLGMNMLLPIALIQLTLPIWLIIKGLKTESSPNDSIKLENIT